MCTTLLCYNIKKGLQINKPKLKCLKLFIEKTIIEKKKNVFKLQVHSIKHKTLGLSTEF